MLSPGLKNQIYCLSLAILSGAKKDSFELALDFQRLANALLKEVDVA